MTQIIRSLTLLTLAAAVVLSLGAVTTPAHAADTGQFEAMAKHYEPIWKALAGDSTDGVAEHATKIAEIAEAGDHPAAGAELVPTIVEQARALAGQAEAGDLEATRNAFYEVTKPLVRYRKAVGAERLAVAYCPMAKKSWLQPEGDIANPYHGSEMLRCGEFVGG